MIVVPLPSTMLVPVNDDTLPDVPINTPVKLADNVVVPVTVNEFETVTNEPVSKIVELVKPPVVFDHFGSVLVVPDPVTAVNPSDGYTE